MPATAPTFSAYNGTVNVNDWRVQARYWVRFDGLTVGTVTKSQTSSSSSFWSANDMAGRLVTSGCDTRKAAADALRPAPTA